MLHHLTRYRVEKKGNSVQIEGVDGSQKRRNVVHLKKVNFDDGEEKRQLWERERDKVREDDLDMYEDLDDNQTEIQGNQDNVQSGQQTVQGHRPRRQVQKPVRFKDYIM